MVVKSATKKKLTDLGVDEEHAHLLADDRKWDDVKILNPQQIAEICQTDSGTAQSIHTKIAINGYRINNSSWSSSSSWR